MFRITSLIMWKLNVDCISDRKHAIHILHKTLLAHVNFWALRALMSGSVPLIVISF